LQCEKDPEAIKECIRLNERLAITLYRDGFTTKTAAEERTEPEAPALKLEMAAPLRRLSV
jgi:hypothetical protein